MRKRSTISLMLVCALMTGVVLTYLQRAIAQDSGAVTIDHIAQGGFAEGEIYASAIQTTTHAINGGTLTEKIYAFDAGDSFTFRKYDFAELEAQTGALQVADEIVLSGQSLSVRYLTKDAQSGKISLERQRDLNEMPFTVLYLETSQESMMLSVPGVYEVDDQNRCVATVDKAAPTYQIESREDGYHISYSFTHDTAQQAQLWFYKTKGSLFTFNEDTISLLWRNDLTGKARLLMDGYYYEIPTAYIPTGDNMYYNNAACHTGRNFLAEKGDTFGTLAYVMLHTCIYNQNEAGYVPTAPVSVWLQQDYGIGGNFYDTRFNADYFTALVQAYQRFGDVSMLHAAERYGAFLLTHTQSHSYAAGADGLLLQDYAGADMRTPTHVSLNHQLAQIDFLLELYGSTSEAQYLALARSLLRGIENTCDEWILPDHNLVYALYAPSGESLTDYPYLTYNDLFETKRLLAQLGLETYRSLDTLMQEKLVWMQANGVQDYRK